MWVSVYIVINLMSQADPKIVASVVSTSIYHPAPQFANDLFANDVLGGVHSIAVNGASAIAQIVRDFIRPEALPPAATSGSSGGSGNGCGFPNVLGCVADVVGGIGNTVRDPFGTANNVIGAAGGAVLGAIGDTIGSLIASVISWVVGIVAYLILIIALFFALIKLWLALLKAYISILIDVIFAPFWIIGGLIPGQQSAGFGAWLKDMAGNLAAFPAAIMMFLLAKLLSDNFITGSGAEGLPISVTSQNMSQTAFIPPLLGNNATNYIASLIALGVILATPGVVEMTKKAVKAPQFKLGGMGAAVGVGTGVAGIPGKIGQIGMMTTYMKNVPGAGKLASFTKGVATHIPGRSKA
jgi:hypothetical protein